ncbi:MAG TPA: hypothetical protein VMS75_10400 [Terriglobales bacterium]|nr:hypothetical protein [Terriglobales bacterium]
MNRVKENKASRPGTPGRPVAGTASGPAAVRLGLRPGVPAIQLLAAAVEKSIRAGAGLISSRHFVWPDFRMMPALVHPSGKAVTPGPARG